MGDRADTHEEDLITTCVMLERRMIRRLDAVARRERRSRSFILRDLIDRALTKEEARR